MAETTRTARTDQLRPGERVVLGAGWPLLGGGVVRTVDRVEPYDWQWLGGDPVILAVRYREGPTREWSAAKHGGSRTALDRRGLNQARRPTVHTRTVPRPVAGAGPA